MTFNDDTYFCPKCRSSYLKIIKDKKRIHYTCENALLEPPLCNWSEIEYLGEKTRSKRNTCFLADFVIKNYEEVIFSYEHLYLIGEKLKIKKMPKLYKEGKLKSEIENEIIKKFPDFLDNPIKHIFQEIQNNFRQNFIETNKNKNEKNYMLIIYVNGASNLIRNNDFDKYFLELFKKIDFHSEKDSNIFIIIKNYFEKREYIPICEKFISFMKNQLNNKNTKIKLKRYILVPLESENILKENGEDEQIYNILHFTNGNKYYYNKKSILQESFWKKWEFGGRKTPYNPFGKDPGSFWVKTTMSSELKKKILNKDFKTQSKIISNSGQEKYEYNLYSFSQVITKCIILGSPIMSDIKLITSLIPESEEIIKQVKIVCEKLNRNFILIGDEK